MDIEKLDNVLESLLFLSGEALGMDTIAQALELQKSEIKRSVARLKKKYGGDCGIRLIEYNNKIQFGSNPDYGEEVSSVLNPIREKELSKATLETVAIIAYKQPVTKLEIEQIRGVNCDYTMQTLLNLGLVESVGVKDAIGHPKLYGTTDEFLKRFGLESIDKLPDYEDLLRSIEELKFSRADAESESLYNQFEIPDAPAEEKPEFMEGEDAKFISSDATAASEVAASTDESVSDGQGDEK